MKYSIVAFDLDGTLLNDEKTVSDENVAALAALARSGVQVVPATGRIVPGMTDILARLPFARWCIYSNGAGVCDLLSGETVYRAEIPLATALEAYEYMDGVDCLYDCYQDNWGYMTRSMYERAGEFYADLPGMLHLINTLREPVDSLPDYLRQKGRPLQKLQMHFLNLAERARQLEQFPLRFPELAVTTSTPRNIEINSADATKGRALQALCAHIGVDVAQTMAFGDGSNDIDMLRAAGLGVAMANATDAVKNDAGYVTCSNNDSGVARAIEKLIFAGTI